MAESLTLLAVVCVLAVAVPALATTAVYRRRVGRALRYVPSGGWGAACIPELGSLRWTALIVDGTGLRLVNAAGRDIANWPWSTIADVTAGPVQPYANSSLRTGLRIRLVDGTSPGLLLPARNLLRYPPEAVQEALTEISRRRPG